MRKFGEKNLDVLQNIEFGIVEVYRADRSLRDGDVQDAIDALVRHYHAEEEHRRPPTLKIGDRAHQVFASVQRMCEWRLGRSLPSETGMAAPAIPVSELIESVREIQKTAIIKSSASGAAAFVAIWILPDVASYHTSIGKVTVLPLELFCIFAICPEVTWFRCSASG
jgi:hypothetical protein